jgi:hypothetical protein
VTTVPSAELVARGADSFDAARMLLAEAGFTPHSRRRTGAPPSSPARARGSCGAAGAR